MIPIRTIGNKTYVVRTIREGEYKYTNSKNEYSVCVGPCQCTCPAFMGQKGTVSGRRCKHVNDALMLFLEQLSEIKRTKKGKMKCL